MTATISGYVRPPSHSRAAESSLTGVGRLLALALRRDRIRLSVWIAVLTLTMWYTPIALEQAYPEAADRIARANLIKTPAGIMFAGPVFGKNETDIGVMFANEVMLTLIVAASILAILSVIRHTRSEEESGAAELVLSSPVGRFARTAAAMVLVAVVNAVLAVTMTLAATAAGLAVTDSAAMSLGITGAAMVFGGVAAVTAQLWRTSRIATGAAMAALAAAVLIRGVGDVINHSGSALSWCSPIAWAQQMRAFADLRWWPLVMLIALAAALLCVASMLQRAREYDAGSLPSGGDHPDAPRIRGVLGLQLTLQRGQVIGWSVGLFIGGLAFGSMTQSLLDMGEENELIARMLSTQGYDGIYTTMTQFLAAAAAAFVVATVVRMNSDEHSGVAEVVLAGSVSRWRWLRSTVAATLVGATVLLFFAGLGNGLGAGIALGEPETVVRLILSALAHLPALAVIAAVSALAFALRQTWIAWLVVTFVVVSLYLGGLLQLPQWLMDLSPVGRTNVPMTFPTTTIAVMAVIAVTLTALAGWLYRRRDAV